MKPAKLTTYFAAVFLAASALSAGFSYADDEPELDSGVRKVIVVKDGDEKTIIDFNINEGTVIVNKMDEDGKEKEEVNLDLGGFIGKNILSEIVAELEEEGVNVDGNIIITKDGGDDQKAVIKSIVVSAKADSEEDTGFGGSMNTFFEAMIAIVAIIMVFGMPLMIVGLVLFARHKRQALINDRVNKILESGQEIPPGVFDEAVGKEKSTYSKGVMLIAIGLGVFIFLGSLAGFNVGSVGLIPALIGLAHIVIWKTDETAKANIAPENY